MAEAQANVMVKDATPKKVMALASRKYSRDDKERKIVAKNGHTKYHKFFNSDEFFLGCHYQ